MSILERWLEVRALKRSICLYESLLAKEYERRARGYRNSLYGSLLVANKAIVQVRLSQCGWRYILFNNQTQKVFKYGGVIGGASRRSGAGSSSEVRDQAKGGDD